MNSVVAEGESCNAYFKKELDGSVKLDNTLKAKCSGKDTCTLANFKNYYDFTSAPSECNDSLTQLFVQVGCMLPADKIPDRQIQGLALACAAVFVALFVLNFVDYIKKV